MSENSKAKLLGALVGSGLIMIVVGGVTELIGIAIVGAAIVGSLALLTYYAESR